MNYEGIAALLYDAYRAGLVLQRLKRERKAAPESYVTLASATELLKKSRLPDFEALDRDTRQLWVWQAQAAHEIHRRGGAGMSYEYNYWPRLEMDPGPWRDEPDHLQFETHGLPCLIVRHPRHGVLCGYVGVPPGHPLHGAPRDQVDSNNPAHWGINYSNHCEPGGLICHVAGPGEPEPWWFGFDCGHAFDLTPHVGESLRIEKRLSARFGYSRDEWEIYRDIAYVRDVCEQLAEWLASPSAVLA